MSVTKLRVLALMHRHLIPPDTIEEGTDITAAPWRTEYDVISSLQTIGHEVQVLGVHDDLSVIRRVVTEWKPHIAFNLLEGFDDIVKFHPTHKDSPVAPKDAIPRMVTEPLKNLRTAR